MPNVWRLKLEFEQVGESGIELFFESKQVVFTNEAPPLPLIQKVAEKAYFDILAKKDA